MPGGLNKSVLIVERRMQTSHRTENYMTMHFTLQIMLMHITYVTNRTIVDSRFRPGALFTMSRPTC